MVDPTLLRDNIATLRTALQNRGVDLRTELEELTTLEAQRRRLLPELEGLKREQNAAGEEAARAKREGRDMTPIQEASRQRAQRIKQMDVELESIEERRNLGLLTIPNVPHSSVPVGKSAADNAEVRKHGEPKTPGFAAQAHWDLGPALGIIDFERGTKIAGARFTVLVGAGARLARALINFMLDLHTREHGYTEVEPPFMANTASLTGTGNLPKFEADLFKIAGEWDLYLVPTAEVPLTNMHRGEILDGRTLPDPLHRLHALLSQRGGILRRRRPRPDPAAPVRQGRTDVVHDAGSVLRRARAVDGQRRGSAEAAGAAVPHRVAVYR